MHQLRGLTEPERVWQVGHPALGTVFPMLRSARSEDVASAEGATLVLRQEDAVRVLEFIRQHRVLSWTDVAGLGPASGLASDVALDEAHARTVAERVRFEIDVELIRSE